METVICTHILNARFGNFHEGFEQRPANAQGSDETMHVLQNGDGSWSVQSPDGLDWLSVQKGGELKSRPVSDPTQPGLWEKFSRDGHTLIELPKDGVTRPLVQLIVRDLILIPGTTPALSRLHIEGREFVTAEGRRHVVKGCTDLLIATRYDLEGEGAILPVLQERHDLGFNNLRVFWQADIRHYMHTEDHAVPWQMPLSKIPAFLALCERYRFYILGTILQQCQFVNPTVPSQRARVRDVRAATQGIDNHLEQLGNEYDINYFDPTNFTRPTDRLAANASNLVPQGSAKWDFYEFSGRRDLPKAIMEYGPVEYLYGDAGIGNIPILCSEGMKPGINTSDPRDFERAGAQARSCCGGRFHTDAGTAGSSRVFNALEYDCARAFLRGIGE